MGSNEYEMEVGDGHDEEAELEEGDNDTFSPMDDQNHSSPQRNGIVNGNGIGNGKENTHLSSKRARDSEEPEVGGASENKTQNGGGSTDPATPRSSSGRLLIKTFRDGGGGGRSSNGTKRLKMIEEDDEAGTKEEQAEFMKELEAFYKGRLMDFKPPKFYGVPLNCLKLWRSVIQLGGYDRVTTYKLWRQIGESFHPPKTCTTISWTFRIFYEKSLLEYEKHKREIGELVLPEFPEDTALDNEGNAYQSSSGRVRRDAAARAMQGWHTQWNSGNGEGEPTIKDKSINTAQRREKHLKNIGVKQKKPSNQDIIEHDLPEANKQSIPTVLDAGPPADWVKITVRESKDCFEVYALVPGLLREEVRVQSDPAGRLVITGQPEQLDNPWGITPFRKVVVFPARIDPLHTSAVVSLHGRLFVRVPFDRSNA